MPEVDVLEGGDRAVGEVPHVAAWREAYRAFGAKPQRTRNNLEALPRRAASGLPRVNRLTDLYNAAAPTEVALAAAADDLATHLKRLGPDVRVARRLITAGVTSAEGD